MLPMPRVLVWGNTLYFAIYYIAVGMAFNATVRISGYVLAY